MYNAMPRKTTGASYLTYRTWTLQAAINLFPGTSRCRRASSSTTPACSELADGLALRHVRPHRRSATSSMYSLTPAGGPSKYTISPDSGQLGTVKLPVSSVHALSVAFAAPIRTN